jgi:ubiquinone biosynthesis protein
LPLIANLRRLSTIGITLARHDALFLVADTPLPGALKTLAQVAARLLRWRDLPLRPGERLAAALTALGPTFIKFGQALSVRPDLVGGDLADDLGRLRDRLPPFADPRGELERALGQPVESLFTWFDATPVAAASIAQVHFAETSDGRPVAVKLLRPGIEAEFARDLSLMRWLAGLAERRASLRRLRPLDVIDTIAEAVAIELDLRLEAAAAEELRDNFRNDAELRVPFIDWPRTSRRVLTLERIGGVPVGDLAALDAAGIDRKKAAAAVIGGFLKQALRDGFFHADLHQGNLFVAPDGTLEPVDFGIMGRLDLETRRFMAEMLHAFITGDWRRAAAVHFEAGYVPATKSREAFAQACRSIGAPIVGRPVAEISIGRLLAQLFEITETFDMRTQPQLLLLQKTMVTVEGVARALDPEVNFWAVSQPIVEQWLRDEMGPSARLEQAASDAVATLRRLPRLLDKLDRAADALSTGAVRVDEASLERLASEQARRRWPLTAGVWLVALIAAVWLLT